MNTRLLHTIQTSTAQTQMQPAYHNITHKPANADRLLCSTMYRTMKFKFKLHITKHNAAHTKKKKNTHTYQLTCPALAEDLQ